MGTYLNPGNSGFARALRSRYVDKTGLIGVVNGTIDTAQNLTCVSRPRRFGKSYAAQMLCAYYDRSVDSHGLFDRLEIAGNADYEKYLNRYDVIYLNMTDILSETSIDDLVPYIRRSIIRELSEAYPGLKVEEGFAPTLVNAVEIIGQRFIVIIDEWDAPLREEAQNDRPYLDFLRALFKSSATTAKLFAAVYMTGILPIKKVRTQSALSDFEEYTMLRPGPFAKYVGFTEGEVRALCGEYGVDFSEMKRWYDGYGFPRVGSVYNPNSVMKAIRSGAFDSYWSQSAAADNLLDFISRDVAGLRQTVTGLMGGVAVEIDTTGYNNDLTYTTRDAALTMLAHLGYLAFDQQTQAVRIPNEEIRLEFARTIRDDRNPETMARVRESDQLIMDTIRGDEAAVAAQIKKVHMETTNPLNANNENALRAVIQMAYFAYKDYYLKLEELPTGEGYADIVYLPKLGKGVPALVVELKWNKSAVGAIRQIRDRQYPRALEGYGGELLLVGINYDKGSREYVCRIEKWR